MLRIPYLILALLSFLLIIITNGATLPASKCTEIKNEVCLTHQHDNCQVSATYPATCVSSSSINTCELVLDWTIRDNIINFKLKKLNYKHNEWTGIIFSKESVKSDIVIGVMPSLGKKAKIING